MGAFESGQAFLAGVLAKLPAEQQAQAKAIFDAAEAKDAVTLVGDSTLARSDYSRSMDQLREKEGALNDYYAQLSGWYDVNKGVLEQARTHGNGNGNGNPNPPLDPNATRAPLQTPGNTNVALSQDDVRRLANDAVNEAGRDYIAVTGFVATLGARHYAMFGEPLDALELVQNPKVGKPVVGQPGRIYSLQDAYQEKFGERLAAKQKETDDKRFNDEVEKRLLERTRGQTTHPFPLRNESSPLDALTTKDGTAAHNLDSAVAEYERLQSARGV